MRFYVDLRFVFVPSIGLVLRFLISQSNSWANYGDFSIEFLGLPLFLIIFVIIVAVILLCLLISVKFPFTVDRIRLQAGDISAPVAILGLASLTLPLPLFWLAYLILLILTPFSGIIFVQLKRLLNWFSHTLRTIPALSISCVAFNQEESGPPPPPRIENC